jgi:hypothetical protein
MKPFIAALVGAALPLAAVHTQESQPLPGGIATTLMTSSLTQVPPPPPPAPSAAGPTIILRDRHGHVTPVREGFNHTGGGNIDIAQPAPDTIIVTMTGAAAAGAHPCKDSVATMQFDLDQCLEIIPGDAKVGRIKVVMEARAIGLLRSHAHHGNCKKGCGTAEMSAACAEILADKAQVVTIGLQPHSVAGGENLSINDHVGPVEGIIAPGQYTFHQTFCITAGHPRNVLPCKAASAEFAPDPALDPLWISYWEPFHGAIKKDFGFQVVLKISPAN